MESNNKNLISIEIPNYTGPLETLLDLAKNQKVDLVFLSSIFKKNKNYLGLHKFINLIKLTKKDVIALGGVNIKNIKLISLTNCFGFAGINYFKKI